MPGSSAALQGSTTPPLRAPLATSAVPGMRWIQVGPRHAGTALALVTWFDTMPAGSLRGLVLTSNDVQADYEARLARGVQFEGPPRRQPWSAAETVLHDPDGNGIVLQQA